MGRTLPSITQTFLMEQEAFTRFRRALRRSDQIALDDLFVSAQKHLAAAAYAAHALPLETFMLSMLLEEHKEVQRLRRQLDEITGQLPAGEDRMLLVEEAPVAESSEDNPALDRLGQRTIPPAGSTQNPAAEFIEAPVAESTKDNPALDRLGQRTSPLTDKSEVIDVDPGLS